MQWLISHPKSQPCSSAGAVAGASWGAGMRGCSQPRVCPGAAGVPVSPVPSTLQPHGGRIQPPTRCPGSAPLPSQVLVLLIRDPRLIPAASPAAGTERGAGDGVAPACWGCAEPPGPDPFPGRSRGFDFPK